MNSGYRESNFKSCLNTDILRTSFFSHILKGYVNTLARFISCLDILDYKIVQGALKILARAERKIKV